MNRGARLGRPQRLSQPRFGRGKSDYCDDDTGHNGLQHFRPADSVDSPSHRADTICAPCFRTESSVSTALADCPEPSQTKPPKTKRGFPGKKPEHDCYGVMPDTRHERTANLTTATSQYRASRDGAREAGTASTVTEPSGPSEEVIWPSVTAGLPRSTGTSTTTPARRDLPERAKRPMTPPAGVKIAVFRRPSALRGPVAPTACCHGVNGLSTRRTRRRLTRLCVSDDRLGESPLTCS
jgi:hypothetical protein